MPITYDVYNDGHFIHAVTGGTVTAEEFIDYEIAHATDKRVRPPVAELLEIRPGACENITKDDCIRAFNKRKDLENPSTPHQCAIVVPYGETRSWDLAKFYEGMVALHLSGRVIVFGDINTAKIWLGIE